MRAFVEPLLVWKGDAAEVPSGGTNPEGSDASPGSAFPQDSKTGRRARRGHRKKDTNDPNANPSNRTEREAAPIDMPRELAANRFAALYDSDGV